MSVFTAEGNSWARSSNEFNPVDGSLAHSCTIDSYIVTLVQYLGQRNFLASRIMTISIMTFLITLIQSMLLFVFTCSNFKEISLLATQAFMFIPLSVFSLYETTTETQSISWMLSSLDSAIVIPSTFMRTLAASGMLYLNQPRASQPPLPMIKLSILTMRLCAFYAEFDVIYWYLAPSSLTMLSLEVMVRYLRTN
jgi:hypothetical protein